MKVGILLFGWLLNNTRTGMAVKAVAQNPVGASGFAEAVRLADFEFPASAVEWKRLRELLEERLRASVPGLVVTVVEGVYDAEADSDWLRQPATRDQRFNPPAPRIEALRALQRDASLRLTTGGRTFFAPQSGDELAGLLANHPDATILAGGTDVGLWVTKQHRELETIIYTGRVAELNEHRVTASHIEIGAAVMKQAPP